MVETLEERDLRSNERDVSMFENELPAEFIEGVE